MRLKNLTKAFPATRKDVNRLRDSATNAVSDLTNHAVRVRSQLQDLASHVQEEGATHINRARGRVTDVVGDVLDFASERPLVCIGAALALGFLIGITRRSRSNAR